MDIEYIQTDPTYHLIKEYGPGNENLKIEDLTEVFVIVYAIKKKGSNQPEEFYSFTTDFEQAMKRFKLLPHTKCLLKRFFTDDDGLIQLAVDGTKPKVTEGDVDGAEIKDILDRFRDEDDDGNVIYENGFKTTEVSDELMKQLNISDVKTPPVTPESKEMTPREIEDCHSC